MGTHETYKTHDNFDNACRAEKTKLSGPFSSYPH